MHYPGLLIVVLDYLITQKAGTRRKNRKKKKGKNRKKKVTLAGRKTYKSQAEGEDYNQIKDAGIQGSNKWYVHMYYVGTLQRVGSDLIDRVVADSPEVRKSLIMKTCILLTEMMGQERAKRQ